MGPSIQIIRNETRIRNHIVLLTNFGYVMKIHLRNLWTPKVLLILSELILVMKMHVRLTVDLNKIPENAWEKRQGTHGAYRRVQYELGLSFGAGGIEWRFLYNGKIMGSVACEYI
jgi:hypothetical protein